MSIVQHSPSSTAKATNSTVLFTPIFVIILFLCFLAVRILINNLSAISLSVFPFAIKCSISFSRVVSVLSFMICLN